MIFYIILGCFSTAFRWSCWTMGVILPTVEKAGIDLVWFGILSCWSSRWRDHAARRLQPFVAGDDAKADHLDRPPGAADVLLMIAATL
jgi:hypothetical protein